MHTQICKSEQGLAIHIPEALAARACLKEGMDVEIKVIDGKVVVASAVKQSIYTYEGVGLTPYLKTRGLRPTPSHSPVFPVNFRFL